MNKAGTCAGARNFVVFEEFREVDLTPHRVLFGAEGLLVVVDSGAGVLVFVEDGDELDDFSAGAEGDAGAGALIEGVGVLILVGGGSVLFARLM